MALKGVYVFFNRCIRDPEYPHCLLFKIGGGIIPDRFECAKKHEGTYLPFPYEIGCAKVTGENWRQHEESLHRDFAAYSITYHHGSGLGEEWFRVPSLDVIRVSMDKMPGEWYCQSIGEDDITKKSQEDQYKQLVLDNKNLTLKTKYAYIDSKTNREFFVSDPERTFSNLWTNWYDFLGVDTSLYPKTKKEWIEKCKDLQIKCAHDYTYRADASLLPREPSYMYNGFTSINEELGYAEPEIL